MERMEDRLESRRSRVDEVQLGAIKRRESKLENRRGRVDKEQVQWRGWKADWRKGAVDCMKEVQWRGGRAG